MIDTNKLQQNLESDYQEAKDRVQASSEALGVKSSNRGKFAFEPTGIRVKGKIIGQAEFANAKQAMDNTIRQLTLDAEMVDQTKAAQYRYDLTKKMNAMKEAVLRAGIEVDRHIKTAKMSQDEKFAIYEALAHTSRGLGEIAVHRSSYGAQNEPEAQISDTNPNRNRAVYSEGGPAKNDYRDYGESFS